MSPTAYRELRPDRGALSDARALAALAGDGEIVVNRRDYEAARATGLPVIMLPFGGPQPGLIWLPQAEEVQGER